MATTETRQSLMQAKKNAKAKLTCAAHCAESESIHPDHTASLNRVRRIQGQLAGIERMISERRYCADILIQMKAVASALKSLEATVLEKHIRSCVADAVRSKNSAQTDKKIAELMKVILQ